MADARLDTSSREYQFGKMQGNYDTSDRVIDWLRSSPRKPAQLAFALGPERALADEIEKVIERAEIEAVEMFRYPPG